MSDTHTNLMTIEEVEKYLAKLEDELDPWYLEDLNGGIQLLPDIKRSPHDRDNSLFILGMYHYEPRGLGRYITIYYGTFARLHAHSSRERQQQALKDVLYHELQHHLESQAGDRTLEKEDNDFLRKYYSGKPTGREG